jgi:acyl-coenzyme A synthetase/AMP-(fatty) acid ligase
VVDNPYRFLEQQAQANPDGIALIDGVKGSTEITFRQLLDATDCIAKKLFDLGFSKGSAVALQMEKKWGWVFTLALWRLGATSVAAASMGTNFESFGVTHVITRNPRTEFSGVLVVIDQEWIDDAMRGERYGRVEIFGSENPYPIIALTSGTTGKPKQVPVSTQMLITRVERAGARNLTGNGVVFLIGGVSHFGQMLNMLCLMRGWPNCVFLPKQEEMRDLPKAIERFEIETLAGAPGQIQAALATVGSELKRSKYLKRIYMGGSIIPESLRDQIIDFYQWRIFTSFASTEVGASTSKELRIHDDPRNLGEPVPEAEIQIVDENGFEVEPGEIGAFRVKTDVMISGYLGNAEASARVFRDGWFYPGDRARWLETGEIYFEGREGEAINLGGLKVDPNVIDQHMITHPKLRDVASFGIEVKGELRYLACAVVPSERVEMQELTQFARRELGERSPAVIFTVESIPRNEANKVQRAQLTKDYSAYLLKVLRDARKK